VNIRLRYLIEFSTPRLIRKNLNRARIRFEQYYDLKANPQVFKKDDYVYLFKKPTKGKFDKQYVASYKIIEILENNNIRIAISVKKIRIVHSDK